MTHRLTIEIPDEVYKEISQEAKAAKLSPEAVTAEWLLGVFERMKSDPLLQLLGSIESDVTDVGEHHDLYIGQALLKESRGENCD